MLRCLFICGREVGFFLELVENLFLLLIRVVCFL